MIGEIQGVEPEGRLLIGAGLTIEEPQAFIAEATARMVVNQIENDGQSRDVAKINEDL
ncbi:hypothetical protein SDC9_195564 [bioreactor metagenome]|uniref:Uncharacterized protein n=1 Tax=bioreactor metagenome TaxID=1076179 RepID=A0A645IA24_9ZZZZ